MEEGGVGGRLYCEKEGWSGGGETMLLIFSVSCGGGGKELERRSRWKSC